MASRRQEGTSGTFVRPRCRRVLAGPRYRSGSGWDPLRMMPRMASQLWITQRGQSARGRRNDSRPFSPPGLGRDEDPLALDAARGGPGCRSSGYLGGAAARGWLEKNLLCLRHTGRPKTANRCYPMRVLCAFAPLREAIPSRSALRGRGAMHLKTRASALRIAEVGFWQRRKARQEQMRGRLVVRNSG
jgi:hypothetical protein